MVKRIKSALNPEKQFVVIDGQERNVTPPFYHEDLANAVLRELSKAYRGLAVRADEVAHTGGSFHEAVKVLSRENRWLEAAHKDKAYFQGLCDGWMSIQPTSLNREVAHV